MVEQKQEQQAQVPQEDQDDLEVLLNKVVENKDTIVSLMDLLEKMKEAGIIDVFMSIAKDYTPTDVEFLAKFFTERELTEALLKVGNSMMGLLYGLAGERTSDVIKAVSFNLQGVTDGLVDGIKNPQSFSALKLMALLKDPDISALITGLVNAAKVLVSSIKKVQ
ncbi:TVG1507900 [Thermoplasma volcanium GSS1]|uniref:TVG1507900 protein n=1 Tax=Thermoplasma volcanium (strain ATCC 51530 / DSM 4299 / JCM 9571 / NBRC 15438 / GSS1) TaxID=273116 RepID=Q978F7_THEVO|nr:DUF1641 domain-containing protein [Thermoplasma volcanium]BAB60600.1 TVG1507900 [Thermoplasma volcanium GSS1]